MPGSGSKFVHQDSIYAGPFNRDTNTFLIRIQGVPRVCYIRKIMVKRPFIKLSLQYQWGHFIITLTWLFDFMVGDLFPRCDKLGRAKRIWYLSPMRAAKVQASLRIRAVSPEPSLLAHTSSESRGTFRQKARSLAPLNGWACAVKICDDGMLEDTNSLGAAQLLLCHLIYPCLVWSMGIKTTGVGRWTKPIHVMNLETTAAGSGSL